MANSGRLRGWKFNHTDGTLETWVDGTLVNTITSAGVSTPVAGMTIASGGLTVTAGGITVTADGLTITAGGQVITAGVLSIDDATESASAVTGSFHTDGGVGIAKNLFLGFTVETADGVGSDGEQFTSGGAAAVCDWASAASQRTMKHVYDERQDANEVLSLMVNTPVYDFKYRSKDEAEPGERIMSTGDVDTVYTGIMADDAPWAMHHSGKILNPITTFGNTILALRALNDRVNELEAVKV